MQFRRRQVLRSGGNERANLAATIAWPRLCFYLFAMALGMELVLSGQQTLPPPRPYKPLTPPSANPMPDANEQMRMRERQARTQTFNAANVERKRQMTEDSARLLKLAADLKAQLDRTGNESLSITAIRRAEEIERLARNVQEKMKLTVGGG